MSTSDRAQTDEVATLVQPIRCLLGRPIHIVSVIEGADRGLTVAVDVRRATQLVVGTAAACDIRLTDPAVSRRHAVLEAAGYRFRVMDLQSTNGTLVNGLAIADAFLHGGETIRCGNTAICIDLEVDARLAVTDGFGRVKGASVAMRRLYPLCERLALSRVPVLLEGEAGTGKELLAESLHAADGHGPFVLFDAGVVVPHAQEAELFGDSRRGPGLLEAADGGTLLVDDITRLEPTVQTRLLRVIDRGELRRVGDARPIRVDVRILAATRQHVDEAIATGQLSLGFVRRVALGHIELPPLRERDGDLPLLVRHFSVELTGSPDAVPPEIVAQLARYDWPGNVRELRDSVARYIATGESRPAVARCHPSRALPRCEPTPTALPFAVARRNAIAHFERDYVKDLLAAHGGNVSHAARASGLALRYFRVLKARSAKVSS